MKCIKCNNEIDSRMKAAISNNLCPFCNNEIMDPEKLKQLKNLEKVLSSKRFTNNDDVNKKIREKVIETLLEHFEFTYTKEVDTEEDVIVLDEQESKVKQEESKQENKQIEVDEEDKQKINGELTEEEKKLKQSPSRSLKEAQQMRQEAKAEAMKEMDPSIFTEAHKELGNADLSGIPDVSKISDEDLATFQGDNEMRKKIESLKKLAPKKLNDIKVRQVGKNNTISRSS